MTSLLARLFLPPEGAKPRQFFSGSDTPEVRGMRAERAIKRDQSTPTGEPDVPDVPDVPLSTAEFAMPAFPFKQPGAASDDGTPPPIQSPSPTAMPSVPLQMTMPSAPPQTTAPTVWPPITRPAQSSPAQSSADRIYRRNLMGLAAALMNRMAESDVMSYELATQTGYPTDTIDALLTGKPGALTLDDLENIAEKLGMVVMLQMRPFVSSAGSQPISKPST